MFTHESQTKISLPPRVLPRPIDQALVDLLLDTTADSHAPLESQISERVAQMDIARLASRLDADVQVTSADHSDASVDSDCASSRGTRSSSTTTTQTNNQSDSELQSDTAGSPLPLQSRHRATLIESANFCDRIHLPLLSVLVNGQQLEKSLEMLRDKYAYKAFDYTRVKNPNESFFYRFPVKQVDAATNTPPMHLYDYEPLYQEIPESSEDESDGSAEECEGESDTEVAALENQTYDKMKPYVHAEFSPSWQAKADLIKSAGLARMCKEGDNTSVLTNLHDIPQSSIQTE